MRIGIMGIGYVGLPLAVAFAEAGPRRRRRRRRPPQDRRARRAASPTSRTSPRERLQAVARPHRGDDARRQPLALRRGARLRPHAADRQPRAGPRAAGVGAARPGRPAAAGPARGPRVDDLPGHDARAVAPMLEESGLRGRARLPPRLLARARRPRAHRLHAAQHAEGRRRPDRGVRRSRRGAVPRGVRRDRPRLHARGRGADQAAGEHLPLGQHRAGQRDGDAHRPHGHRHLGGRRRRRDQALRLHALRARARAWAATACRSTRSTCRGARASST